MIQGVSDPGLEEAETLYGDSKVMVVPREIFTRFGVAVSLSLRYSNARKGRQTRESAHRSSGCARD